MSVVAQAALDAIERERAELVFRASRDERRVYEEALKAIPDFAEGINAPQQTKPLDSLSSGIENGVCLSI